MLLGLWSVLRGGASNGFGRERSVEVMLQCRQMGWCYYGFLEWLVSLQGFLVGDIFLRDRLKGGRFRAGLFLVTLSVGKSDVLETVSGIQLCSWSP